VIRAEFGSQLVLVIMAAGIGGCCGTKKQKLSNCSPIALNSNGIDSYSNGINGYVMNGLMTSSSGLGQKNGMIVSSDMCFFCFDVLSSHLNRGEIPNSPSFPNEAQYVFFMSFSHQFLYRYWSSLRYYSYLFMFILCLVF